MSDSDAGLQKWVCEALDLGLGCFEEGDRSPFIILIADGERQLMNLQSADGTMSEALLESGRELIRQSAESGQYYVLVWDGYLTTGGKRQDAVFAEAGAAGDTLGRVFAQKYKQAKSGKVSRIGKPVVAAEVSHLWCEENA